ncbi:nucleotidyltransferase family protein [Collinsella tanakaei]|uniref:nucleotidyltransferase family protein n=1 Tax=Collinsella tanakaei TaxID=626935 RepID=UPI0025A3F28F|nr:nucleotidyltransferase domain-containing protein [Collinsella tanakaei]MDM8299903.1 nucleotidyltransferase domain-containing protein [Collinsella tanakaei]
MLEISTIRHAVQRVAQAYGLTRATPFGSFARGRADDSSDVDLVVETSRPLGFARGAISNELEEELGRPVDIVFGAANLYPFVREAFEREGVTLYEE